MCVTQTHYFTKHMETVKHVIKIKTHIAVTHNFGIFENTPLPNAGVRGVHPVYTPFTPSLLSIYTDLPWVYMGCVNYAK